MKVSTDNKIASIGELIRVVFLPISLWIGAIAIFLALRPYSKSALASTSSTGRLAARGISRAAAVASAQAVVLVALLQAISPFLPLTYAVQGMQGIVSGAGGGSVAAAAAVLALFCAASTAPSLWIIGRKRGAGSFGYVLAKR